MAYANNNSNNSKIIPRYANAGRKDRVEKYGRGAECFWFQHCQANDLRYEPFADDRLSTRKSCKLPDCLTDGVPTELTMWPKGWKSGEFRCKHVQILASKIWMREAYAGSGGYYVMISLDGVHGVKVPFDLKLPEPVMSPTAEGMQSAYRFPIEQCEKFKLGKVRTELN